MKNVRSRARPLTNCSAAVPAASLAGSPHVAGCRWNSQARTPPLLCHWPCKAGRIQSLGCLSYGVRWQSEAATPLWVSERRLEHSGVPEITLIQSGVAPLFPLAAALHIRPPFAAAGRIMEKNPLNFHRPPGCRLFRFPERISVFLDLGRGRGLHLAVSNNADNPCFSVK